MQHEQTLRVFISSTFIDLKEYRQAVFDAIVGAGLVAENMIYWSADERTPSAVSVDKVRQADAMILILAHRYGYVPEGAKVSITEQEYRAARAANIPVLAFLVDENLPWPPQFIEWEKRDRLSAFKQQLTSEVVARTFANADHLASLASQALVGLRLRSHRPLASVEPDYPTIRVDSAADLKTRPDLNIQIGSAEDRLPLIVAVRRAQDTAAVFDALQRLATRPGYEPPTALISSFRQLIEEHALRAWASDAVVSVRMLDRSSQDMLVCRPTLSSLFRSTFECLLEHPGRAPRRARPATAITAAVGTTPAAALERTLQSEGGSNRFLGISIHDGQCFSVGKERDGFGTDLGTWVEWRPFVFESIVDHFPDAEFVLGREVRVRGESYLQSLTREAARQHDTESVRVPVSIEVTKTAVAKLMLDIGDAISRVHSAGLVHGDLKPANVLLTSSGVTLIDEFGIRPGQLAPGWTPGWSAPEQALGEPVSCATDMYPFGRLLAELIEGQLVGEVRKFKVSFGGKPHEEFDVFYNPSVRVSSNSSVGQARGLRQWTELARKCLRFLPEERPSITAFRDELGELLTRCPLQGVCHLDMPDNLVRASFIGGSTGLARRIIADMTAESDVVPAIGGAVVMPPPPAPGIT